MAERDRARDRRSGAGRPPARSGACARRARFLDADRDRHHQRPARVRAAGAAGGAMTEPSVDVAVIVVNFNTGALARRAVESAAADLALAPGRAWTAIIVDNASSDGGPALLQDLPQTRVIANERNVGFGAAINQAARTTGAR